MRKFIGTIGMLFEVGWVVRDSCVVMMEEARFVVIVCGPVYLGFDLWRNFLSCCLEYLNGRQTERMALTYVYCTLNPHRCA